MHRIRTIFAASVLVAAAAQAASESTIHRTFNVAPGGTLTLETDVGEVHVTSATSNTVTVEVKRQARGDAGRDFNVTFDQTGNDVTIRGKYDRRDSWFNWSSDL